MINQTGDGQKEKNNDKKHQLEGLKKQISREIQDSTNNVKSKGKYKKSFYILEAILLM